MSHLVEILAALIGGGLVTKVFDYIGSRSKENRVDFETLLSKLNTENDELKATNKELQIKITSLEMEMMKLRSKMLLLESSHMVIPIPMWLKDVNGKMIALNQAYENEFLKPNDKKLTDYIGKRDTEIYGDQIGNQYWEHDKIVINSKQIWIGLEDVAFPDRTTKYYIVKFPRQLNGIILGIGGLAFKIPKNNE